MRRRRCSIGLGVAHDPSMSRVPAQVKQDGVPFEYLREVVLRFILTVTPLITLAHTHARTRTHTP